RQEGQKGGRHRAGAGRDDAGRGGAAGRWRGDPRHARAGMTGRPTGTPGQRGGPMQLTPGERDRLDDYRQMMGDEAGNLALALDSLTDGMALIGQHAVYCRVERGPRAGAPALDLAEVLDALDKAKALVQETLLKLRQDGP